MNRRNFFSTGIVGITALLGAGKAFAGACKVAAAPAGKKLAKLGRLGYVLNAADAKAEKKFKAGSTCGNCKYYKNKKEVGAYAPCLMMSNGYVSTCGWCKSWKKV